MKNRPVSCTGARAHAKPAFFANFGGPRMPRSVANLVMGEEGALTVMFALTASVMIGTLATALDTIDVANSSSRMQMALDVATLSAGADLAHFSSTTGANLAQWQADARAYYDANMPTGYLGLTMPNSNFTATVTGSPATGQTIQLSASGSVPLYAPYIFGTTSSSSGGTGSGGSGGSGTTQPTTQTISASNSALRLPKSTLELALILDNTGSMADTADGSSTSSGASTKLQGLQSAANTLIGQILGVSGNDSYIGLVPFTTMVNVKGSLSTNGSWMQQDSSKWLYNSTGVTISNWSGCVVEPHDSSGHIEPQAYAPKSSPGFTPWYFNVPPSGFSIRYYTSSCNASTSVNPNPAVIKGVPLSYYRGSYGSATLCSGGTATSPTSSWSQTTTSTNITYDQNGSSSDFLPCSIQPVVFLTKNQNTLTSAINSMKAYGSTMIPTGLLWGWRMLSSDWSPAVAGSNNGWTSSSDTTLPRPETTQGLQRVAIVLTDGVNDPGTTSGTFPMPYFNQLSQGDRNLKSVQLGLNGVTSSADNLNTFQLGVCSAMKNSGITIYAITFGKYGTDSTSVKAQQTMQSCATPGNYYHAPDNATLNQIFQQIAGNLGVLRLTQ
ncbi:VWA domain-containing protein [Caballeronia sp. BCC1704]|uniref:TadE/TadG family type IV pilus assembly protein n=1 Tax=Caballeronia sp. BCC1704 TaxID=2676300 RepID=UPI001FC7C8F8|nr:VWA domain-containing protein [Caballeronia sp. BCC1704]